MEQSFMRATRLFPEGLRKFRDCALGSPLCAVPTRVGSESALKIIKPKTALEYPNNSLCVDNFSYHLAQVT